MVLAWGGLLSSFMLGMSTSTTKFGIKCAFLLTQTVHVHGLVVPHGQYNTLLWKELFRWLRNAAGPLDVP